MVSSLVKFHMSLTNPVPELSLSFNPFIGRGSESSKTGLDISKIYIRQESQLVPAGLSDVQTRS